ncbi:hypothetical protein KP77_20660 [Jeotgalibacillus alimentarius]|uniref:YozE SAM-like domain-containing protein n=1 Tax=Jeotgalibacillus alimentarius TaxID=135826 RepID=A0A0C2RF83_9BACL|nr:YozE family protein [Jeotgalibacillus alimentarius]KIL48855.1 hypothetical protein KP77_20660 [Jeotgalibacillus alimentarius]
MKTFYHFVLKYREPVARDSKEELANKIYDDSSFPKRSKNYDEISSYIETSDIYYSLAVTFDELWEEYRNDKR